MTSCHALVKLSRIKVILCFNMSYVLDGVPRWLAQAFQLSSWLELELVNKVEARRSQLHCKDGRHHFAKQANPSGYLKLQLFLINPHLASPYFLSSRKWVKLRDIREIQVSCHTQPNLPLQLQKDRPPLGWSSPGSVFSEDRGPGCENTRHGFMMQLCQLAALVTFVNAKTLSPNKFPYLLKSVCVFKKNNSIFPTCL